MKIFDCFMYFDEEVVLDLRLNVLNEYVDYFVIVESIFTHKGDRRKLQFNHKKFKKFQDKIIYLTYDEEPKNIEKILLNENEEEKSRKYIFNAAYRENGQRNFIINGLDKAQDDDIILISDVDEIPNLDSCDLKKINQKIILFRQDMFYYKFNLQLPNLIWTGTKGCKRKNIYAAIGPCITQKNYNVKEDFLNRFLKKDKKNKIFFKKRKNIIYFDLPNYVKSQLKINKISNIDLIKADTFDYKNNFFSARRSLRLKHADYGRNISIIMIN